ncbi:monovalent cation/H+ antiporter subunit D [Qipengyuania sp.]|uniref:monovalent cation/H+ antiporter subunit D n=1 Tax=Qipengyuania sp. TaxID=2004515 RepID=UPI0037363137
MTVALADHLIVLPILLPLLAGAAMLLLDERRLAAKRAISLATVAGVLVNNLALLLHNIAAGFAGAPATRAYLAGDWPAAIGIVMVADWLSVMMLLLTAVLALCALIYATARWDGAGPRFHSLFMFQLMGINGAFLTGDLFNLFVFFEVLLAASFGLMLHGSGVLRVRAGLHYVAISIAGSLLFLIGTALIYSVTGTLNMAELALQLPATTGSDLPLLQSGIAVLGLAFLLKAGMWPLGFWLPATYSAAAPPVAALFAILSKVGVYAILRIYLLLFGGNLGWSANFGEEWLLYGGLATIAFGITGVLAARSLTRVAGYNLIVSSGTLLAAIGAGGGVDLGSILYYLVSSTLGLAAFYLLIELVERRRTQADVHPVSEPVFDDEYTGGLPQQDESEIGVAIPATIAILGGGFIFCALILAGLPPLSGFIGKFAIIDGLLRLSGPVAGTTWVLVALIVASGMATLIATTRAGIDLLWEPSDQPQPVLHLVEAAPVGILLTICLGLMVFAGPVMRYMDRTSQSLGDRQGYVEAVLAAPAGRGGALGAQTRGAAAQPGEQAPPR